MTISLTFSPTRQFANHYRALWPAIFLAAGLIAIAAPAPACEKAVSPLIAKAPAETRAPGAFTGEFVGGAPVYRLPSITVVGRREADIAKTQRDARRSRNG
jgi:hypothetical protein